ncbi:MAG: hypothetical protein A2Y77_06660 [Planctomycetes bacterium RBG_13_62_9]|nr:MAG: hypothetical protein A2Y77_06660 [Planctomycetes bacterium RBG_13_62_9]
MGGLKPARASLNRDQLMFQAGRASARRRNHLWQAVTCCLGIVLAVSIVYRPAPRAVEPYPSAVASGRMGGSPAHAVQSAWATSRPSYKREDTAGRGYFAPVNDYVRMRGEVLRRGIDALPTSHPAPATDEGEPMTGEHLYEVMSST